MSKQRPAETISCNEYQQLFDECESAREILKAHREQMNRFPSAEEVTVQEVLGSQVRYAQACLLLRTHAESCLTCQVDSDVP